MKSIGETVYWVESSTSYGVKIPCPMCFGKRFVTIILGDDSRTEIICGMCSHGLETATGQASSWEASARIMSGAITGISTRDGCKYEVGYHSVYQHECFDSEEEAIPVRDRKLKEEQERRELWHRDHFVQMKKNQVWSAGYHRSCIASAERTISWHKSQLNMINERQKK